nr:MAG TPA: hypothetical protein [Caudoviricetes sp.]
MHSSGYGARQKSGQGGRIYPFFVYFCSARHDSSTASHEWEACLQSAGEPGQSGMRDALQMKDTRQVE